MASNGGDDRVNSGKGEVDCAETTVEIKIKTLDSQTYTMRVDKCVCIFSFSILSPLKDCRHFGRFFGTGLYITTNILKFRCYLLDVPMSMFNCIYVLTNNCRYLSLSCVKLCLRLFLRILSVYLNKVATFCAGSCPCIERTSCFSYRRLVGAAAAYMPWKSFEGRSTPFSLSYPLSNV